MRSLIPMFLFATLTGAAQQTGQNAPLNSDRTFTISVGTQLVVETVVVKDKQGSMIRGLTAKDFNITEDSAPQTIRFCEHQELPAAAIPLAPSNEEQLTLYK